MRLVAKLVCPICGQPSGFYIAEEATLLREASCEHCGVSLRTADTAVQLMDRMGGGREFATLRDCAQAFPSYRILNLFSIGKIHTSLQGLPGYSCGEFFDGVKSGEFKDGVQCVDLQNMPFPKNTFDFIVTEDVLEHVKNPQEAFQEIRRVLRPGGCHIFTVPVHEKQATVSREGRVPVYHGDPLREQGALVTTDFGCDLTDLLRQAGMEAHRIVAHRFFFPGEISYLDEPEGYAIYSLHQEDLLQAFQYNSIVFVAVKPLEHFWSAWF